MRRAVFFDRDGVINEVVFRNGKAASPRTFDELILVPEASEAAASLAAAGFSIFVVTNQPDVARDKMTIQDLERMHVAVQAHVHPIAIRACTHDDHHQCNCRKPKPGMLLELAAEHEVDLARSFFIGDSHKDMDAGRAAGCPTILLKRDYNRNTSGTWEVDSVLEAARVILKEQGE